MIYAPSALILLQNGAIFPPYCACPFITLPHPDSFRVGTCTVASRPFSRYCEPQIYKSRFYSPTIFSTRLTPPLISLTTLSHRRTNSIFWPHPHLSTSSRYSPAVSSPELCLTSGSEVTCYSPREVLRVSRHPQPWCTPYIVQTRFLAALVIWRYNVRKLHPMIVWRRRRGLLDLEMCIQDNIHRGRSVSLRSYNRRERTKVYQRSPHLWIYCTSRALSVSHGGNDYQQQHLLASASVTVPVSSFLYSSHPLPPALEDFIGVIRNLEESFTHSSFGFNVIALTNIITPPFALSASIDTLIDMRIRVYGSRRRTLWILVVSILPTPPTAIREGVSEGKQLLLLVYLSYTARPSPSDTEQRRSPCKHSGHSSFWFPESVPRSCRSAF